MLDPGDFVKVAGSSNIEAVGHDEANNTLYVEYKAGKTGSKSMYSYTGVPKEVFDELLDSPSKGKYMHSKIRGAYEYSKID